MEQEILKIKIKDDDENESEKELIYLEQNYKKLKNIIMVLATEERDRERAEANAKILQKEFGSKFGHFLVTSHPGDIAGEVVGGKPYPGRCEITAPVLVGVTKAILRTDHVAAPVPDDLPFELRLHALGVPEHLDSLRMAENLICPKTHVKSRYLLDF